jgi:hypothetical protein
MKRATIALSTIFSFALLGAAASATPSPTGTGAAGGTGTAGNPETVVVKPDVGAYMPPIDRAWTPGDYEAASLLLSRVSPEKLVTSWPDPSAVFLRIVNPENLNRLYDTEQKMSQRVLDARRYMMATAQITTYYLPDSKVNQGHREDVARLEGLFLQELGALMTLVREIETIPPLNFDDHAVVDSYIDEIKRGLDRIVGDFATSLATRQSRSEDARLRLARILSQEYPYFYAYLTPDTRKNVERILISFQEPVKRKPDTIARHM